MVTLHLSNESYFKHIMSEYQRPMESLGQKEARKKRITRNDKRLGHGRFSLEKLLRMWILPSRDITHGNQKWRFGVKEINVKCNKQGEVNKEKSNRTN